MNRTHSLSEHRIRRVARARERELQAALDRGGVVPGLVKLADGGYVVLPEWAHGVRVEKTGLFQWTLVATEQRQH